MIGSTLSFVEARRNNRVPNSVWRYVDEMNPRSQWMTRFAIRWCIRYGYIDQANEALAKWRVVYGAGGANWRELHDMLDMFTQHNPVPLQKSA